MLLVFAGGTVGSAVRIALQALIDPVVPWLALPLVNVLGSFLLGVTVALASKRVPERAAVMSAFWGTGMMGGFTTYSALAVFSLDPAALPVSALTVVAGLGAAVAGLMLARPRKARA
ncbi:hypothetical protein GCM10009808_23410 [Microbacterium sediminicola]|uniref:Fluoride-specific ion channel FluC n=1 Tax=Microbacterium sediminicola TaxID=415210 RepID=A0ABN2IH55_9MICO